MYTINIDKEKNRVIVFLQGTIGRIESEKIARELFAAVGRLRRGFDVINDISRYEDGDRKSEETLKSTIEFLKVRGVRNVVRVVGGSKDALMKFSGVSKSTPNYTIRYVPTLEAAIKLLEPELQHSEP